MEKLLYKTKSGWLIKLITDRRTCFAIQDGYRVEFTEFKRYFRIDDQRETGTGMSDYPIKYDHNGRIAYNYPELLPDEIKQKMYAIYQRYGKFIY